MNKRIQILCIFVAFVAAISGGSDNFWNKAEDLVFYNIDALASNEGGGGGIVEDFCFYEGSLDCPGDNEYKYEYVGTTKSKKSFFEH